MLLKRCPRCTAVKPVLQFTADPTSSDGYKSCCAVCDAASSRQYYEANRARVLERQRRKRQQAPEPELKQNNDMEGATHEG